MKLPKELTTVTPFSKYLAMVLFIALPIVGFSLGMRYQETLNLAKRQEMEANLVISRVPTPTPNETVYTEATRSANWKTYTNTHFGFSFKYPENFTFDKLTDGGLLFRDGNQPSRVVIVKIYTKGERTTLRESYAQSRSIPGSQPVEIYTDTQDRNWTLVRHGGIDRGYSLNVEYEGTSKNYLIEIQTLDEKQLILFTSQILSTFKFTQ